MNKIKILSQEQLNNIKNTFWDRVLVKDTHSCWNWLLSTTRVGYGSFKFKGNTYGAHRVAYMLEYGPLYTDLLVCHSCDNRKCCNPGHLFLGNNKDNSDDKILKGRQVITYGEEAGNSKLSEIEVIRIRELYNNNNNYTQQQIAGMFNITQRLVSYIVNRKLWTHV